MLPVVGGRNIWQWNKTFIDLHRLSSSEAKHISKTRIVNALNSRKRKYDWYQSTNERNYLIYELYEFESNSGTNLNNSYNLL